MAYIDVSALIFDTALFLSLHKVWHSDKRIDVLCSSANTVQMTHIGSRDYHSAVVCLAVVRIQFVLWSQ
jgi:hypothetical protein